MQPTEIRSTLQPAERVRDYLEREFLSRPELQKMKEARLPTAEEIAGRLRVSVRTVQKVVARMAGEGLLQTIQGKGTFINKPRQAARRSLTVGTNMLVFNPGHSLNWSETIYLGAVRMAAAMRRNISVMPVASAPECNQTEQERAEQIFQELRDQIDHIDMLMLFGDKKNAELCEIYEAAGKPTVTINPPTIGATSNFVSTDYFEAGHRLGSALYEAGRRRFIYIAPLHFIVSQSLLRYGFTTGCRRDLDAGVEFHSMAFANDGHEYSGIQKEIHRLFTKGGPRPDAIFCMSDIVAEQVHRQLVGLGISVPEEVSIVAGTGLPAGSLSNPGLTRIMQPMDQIGANVVRMLCHRYDNQCQLVPGLYLRAPLHLGSTSRAEENALWERAELQAGREPKAPF